MSSLVEFPSSWDGRFARRNPNINIVDSSVGRPGLPVERCGAVGGKIYSFERSVLIGYIL